MSVNLISTPAFELNWTLSFMDSGIRIMQPFGVSSVLTGNVFPGTPAGMPDAAISAIRELQPYNLTDFRISHLWKLNKLWNIDKHRHVLPHGVVTDWLFNINTICRLYDPNLRINGVLLSDGKTNVSRRRVCSEQC